MAQTQQQRLTSLVNAVGADVKTLTQGISGLGTRTTNVESVVNSGTTDYAAIFENGLK